MIGLRCSLLLRFVMGALLLGANPATAQTADTASQELSQSIGRLLPQLDADRATDRNRAITQLVALAAGSSEQADALLALLPKERDQMPPSVRAGLRAVRDQVERQLAESFTQGSLVSLDADGTPLAEVLEAIRQQTGNRLRDNRENFGEDRTAMPVTLSADAEPFWPTVDALLDRAGLDVYAFGGRTELALVTRGKERGPRSEGACYAGPFRIEPLRVVSTAGLRDPKEQRLELHLEIAWEPRLQPVALSQSLAELQVVSDTGQALVPDPATRSLEVEVSSSAQATQIVVPLMLPEREARAVASFRGTLHALVPGRRQTFRFQKIQEAKHATQSKGATTVTLEKFFKNNAIWELRMRMQLDNAGDALASHRGWVFNNPSHLETPTGQRIEQVGFETTLQAENQIGIAYLFDLDSSAEGEPRSVPINPLPIDPEQLVWVYESPTGVVELPVEYTFEDLRLP